MTIPAAWSVSVPVASEALESPSLVTWWECFQDPVLSELVASALEQSADIRTAWLRIDEARARRGLSKAALLPSVSGGVSANGTRSHDRLSNETTRGETYGGSVDASWEIDLFGTQRAALAAADASLEGTIADYHAAQVSLVAEVASTYITYRNAQTLLDVTERNLGLREETTQLTLWREEAGIGDGLSSRQAQATLHQTEARLPALRQNILEAKNALCVLLGLAPGALDTPLASALPVPVSSASPRLGLPAEILRQRPDVRSAEQNLLAAAASEESVARSRWPSLSLSGSIGTTADEPGIIFSPETLVARLAGQLTAPLFDAGRISRNVEIAEAQTEEALIAYENTLVTALAEVENALAKVRSTDQRRASLEKALEASRKAASLAETKYQAGEVDLFTVLDAQNTLLSIEESMADVAANAANAQIQLYKALGGGWSPLTENLALR